MIDITYLEVIENEIDISYFDLLDVIILVKVQWFSLDDGAESVKFILKSQFLVKGIFRQQM